MKSSDIREFSKKKNISRRKYSVNTLTDIATVDFGYASSSSQPKDNFIEVDGLIVFFLYAVQYSFVNTGFHEKLSVNLRDLCQISHQWASCQWSENLLELQGNSFILVPLT